MITLRCTAKVARRFGLSLSPRESADTDSLLGDWYAHLYNFGPTRWVLCLNETSNLPVLVRARNADFPDKFPVQLGLVLRRIGVPPEHAARESMRSSEMHFGKTLSRSMLGSMNDMVFHMDYALDRWRNPVAAAADLADMPCRAPKYIYAREVVFQRLGIPELYVRKTIRLT